MSRDSEIPKSENAERSSNKGGSEPRFNVDLTSPETRKTVRSSQDYTNVEKLLAAAAPNDLPAAMYKKEELKPLTKEQEAIAHKFAENIAKQFKHPGKEFDLNDKQLKEVQKILGDKSIPVHSFKNAVEKYLNKDGRGQYGVFIEDSSNNESGKLNNFNKQTYNFRIDKEQQDNSFKIGPATFQPMRRFVIPFERDGMLDGAFSS